MSRVGLKASELSLRFPSGWIVNSANYSGIYSVRQARHLPTLSKWYFLPQLLKLLDIRLTGRTGDDRCPSCWTGS